MQTEKMLDNIFRIYYRGTRIFTINMYQMQKVHQFADIIICFLSCIFLYSCVLSPKNSCF